MNSPLLPPPPRLLEAGFRRELWLGTPLLFFALSNLFLACLLALFLLLIYGFDFSSVRSTYQDAVRVHSQIHKIEEESLPSGGKVKVVSAQVKVNDVVMTVRGYGPAAEKAQEGDPVEILIPKTQANQARLLGFQSHPADMTTLLSIAAIFAVPGFLMAPLAVFRSARRQKLLIYGEEQEGLKSKTLPLPRPLKDKALVRWTYQSPKGPKTFWCLQDREVQSSVILSHGQAAAPLHNLLPEYELEQKQIKSPAKLGQYLLGLNLALLAVSFSLFSLFLLT